MTTASARTRARAEHPEILDDQSLDPRLVRRSMRDVEKSNALFGGTRAVLRELERALPSLPLRLVLLDVGTGMGDIPSAARAMVTARGRRLVTIGVDLSRELAAESAQRLDVSVVADAGALPLRDGSVDVVTCSQLVHHFDHTAAVDVIRELERVARQRVIVSDLRRSWFAAAGLWLASFFLRFHPVSRHDGVASVRRGFAARELRALVTQASGQTPEVRRYAGFRVTASWTPRRWAG